MKITETRLRELIRETLAEVSTLDLDDETPPPGVAWTESGGYTLPNGDYLDFEDYLAHREHGVSHLDAHMQMIRALQAAGIEQVVDLDGDSAVHSLAAWEEKVRRAQAGR